MTVTATKDAKALRVSVGDDVATIAIPTATGKITELRACSWMDVGVAVAVETLGAKSGERSYYWATVLGPWP